MTWPKKPYPAAMWSSRAEQAHFVPAPLKTISSKPNKRWEIKVTAALTALPAVQPCDFVFGRRTDYKKCSFTSHKIQNVRPRFIFEPRISLRLFAYAPQFLLVLSTFDRSDTSIHLSACFLQRLALYREIFHSPARWLGQAFAVWFLGSLNSQAKNTLWRLLPDTGRSVVLWHLQVLETEKSEIDYNE